jgi:hypothetical protein
MNRCDSFWKVLASLPGWSGLKLGDRLLSVVPADCSIANPAGLANADANNEPGRARIYLDQLTAHEQCEQVSPTIVASSCTAQILLRNRRS